MSNCSLGTCISFHDCSTDGVMLLLCRYFGVKFLDNGLLNWCLVCLFSVDAILTIGLDCMVDGIFPSIYQHFNKEINEGE